MLKPNATRTIIIAIKLFSLSLSYPFPRSVLSVKSYGDLNIIVLKVGRQAGGQYGRKWGGKDRRKEGKKELCLEKRLRSIQRGMPFGQGT